MYTIRKGHHEMFEYWTIVPPHAPLPMVHPRALNLSTNWYRKSVMRLGYSSSAIRSTVELNRMRCSPDPSPEPMGPGFREGQLSGKRIILEYFFNCFRLFSLIVNYKHYKTSLKFQQ